MPRFHHAIALAVIMLGLGTTLSRAQPMRCSGEYKTCVTACAKAHNCVQNCAARLSDCMKTGCWQGGNYRVCSLLRQ